MFSLLNRLTRRCRPTLETLEDRLLPAPLPVLMVLPNRDFFYRDYSDTRRELTAAGIDVDVAAATPDLCRPHAASGQGSESGLVQPDLMLSEVNAADYSAIVFVGGWGASAYQFAFAGTYANSAYNGSAATHLEVNRLIGDFLDQDKSVAAICYGVTALAWARIDGVSPLEGRTVTAYSGSAPWSNIPAANMTRWHIETNGAAMVPSGSIGDPGTVADDVIVDGRIITAEDWRSASAFGQAIAAQVQAPTISISAAMPSIAENGSGTVAFTVQRSTGDSLDQPLTIRYTVGGTAMSGVDFAALAGSVTLAAGQASATITLVPLDDASVEGAETVVISMQDGPGYDVAPDALASVAILDDDRLPVLMVIANVDFYFQEYNDTRISLEAAGLTVHVAAETLNWCRPHFNSGQGSALGYVLPDLTVLQARASDYSAIVFVGGWGSSSYQYAFDGTYQNTAYRGTTQTKAAVNQLINDFVAQDKIVAGICHGVTALAYARVNGVSLLQDRTVSAYAFSAPARIDAGNYVDTTRWHIETNGATMVASRSVGNPFTAMDDVIVDGRIITAENFDSALMFGQVVANEVIG